MKTGKEAISKRNGIPVTIREAFYVGDKVSEQDIKARFANGVLYVYVPKFDDQPEVEEKKIISIEG